MRSPRVYWRWFRLKEISKGWEPTDTGWVLTIAVIVLVQSLALTQQCDRDGCTSKLDEFLDLKPSEMGDTLAGLFSALAFIWIIVTVFMQSRELREQRKEFREQRKATQEMARAMAAQAKVFEDEQRQRDEGRAETLLDERLRSFVIELSESRQRGLIWHFSNQPIDDEFGSYGDVIDMSVGKGDDEEFTVDAAIVRLRRRLKNLHESLWDLLHQSVDYRLPKDCDIILDLITRLQSIAALKNELSAPQQERLTRMKLTEVISRLYGLIEQPDFWEKQTP